jgi:hypothetical protein
VLKEFWSRLKGERQAEADKRAQEWEHMSPEERAYISEGASGHEADEQSQALLGGENPDRLIEE